MRFDAVPTVGVNEVKFGMNEKPNPPAMLGRME